MNANMMEDVRREIDEKTRIRDELPERIPTALARELANSYPAEVQANRDRLASLAGDIIRRERAAAANERAVRFRETSDLRQQISGLEAELTRVSRLHQASEAATEVLRERLRAIGERVRRFGRNSRASKRGMVGQVLGITSAPLPLPPPTATGPRH